MEDDSYRALFAAIHKYDVPNRGYTYIGWNEKHPMFADVKTRTALTMLTDRERIVQSIMRGHAYRIVAWLDSAPVTWLVGPESIDPHRQLRPC